jgi:hypothetical protein
LARPQVTPGAPPLHSLLLGIPQQIHLQRVAG